ncbi:M1 family aminopeptidase [Galbibacter sp. PAP.153]|uniref:M1 family aminopeptidase n=1 Tax=Galbibacter sp. PAP.153 TaxID=3104623 RepID=UPI00300B10E8
MNTVFLNDLHIILKQKYIYVALIVLAVIGFWAGYKFSINIGEGIYINAPYSVGFMIGLLSLAIILMATLLAFALLFKERDSNFNLIIFTTPIKKKTFACARFFSFYSTTLFSFFILITGYVAGLYTQTETEISPGFNLWHFLYPFITFGMCNALFICSILFFIAQKLQNKLMVAISGLMLYVLYMVVMVFSNAPFMAQALPQSLFAQRISALVDPFGLSSYFFEGKDLTVYQRNTQVVSFTNLWLINRLSFFICSICFLYGGIYLFSFLSTPKAFKKQAPLLKTQPSLTPFTQVTAKFDSKSKWYAILSFIKIDCIYLFKSISLIAISVLLLFYVGMEMYADIDKGIRLPQYYASSGLLAQTINGIFYFIGGLTIVYFVNDVFWRSKAEGFSVIQDTTYYSKEKLIGNIGSILFLISYFTLLMIMEAITFQFLYNFPYFDWNAYYGVIVFNTFPLILLSLFLFFINNLIKNKNLALGISMAFFVVFGTKLVQGFIKNPLFRFLSDYKGTYSDFLGYGGYLPLFLWRLSFGFLAVALLFLLYGTFKNHKNSIAKIIGSLVLLVLCIIISDIFLHGYIPRDNDLAITKAVRYEKTYRKYQNIPQPTIKKVIANIDLFPEDHAYKITGSYVIKNMHQKPIDSILLHIPEDFIIKSFSYQYKNEKLIIDNPVSALFLQKPLQPNDTAKLKFELKYKWYAVNGHDAFNAIVENGSFMRISNYFPRFGYDEGKETMDSNIRNKYNLGEATGIKPLGAPKENTDDFIDLELEISTPQNQIAVGTGELTKHWKNKKRNYFTYRANAIPFRFALSSAKYLSKSTIHNGITIKVLYNALHDNNVDHLIKNTILSLDYCTKNFGPYPFKEIVFAEISSFTSGFAGTAYPGVIFMTENMIFNANIKADDKQDVINELAGHEVSHIWWGNNQINPDYREGYAMLTESLAMYTELMIYKKMHGEEKMKERIQLHRQIYNAEKGYYKDVPLIKATKNQPYIAYSKGAVIFAEISKLIGEDRLNLALKNFLCKYKYPNPKPISTDLLDEILRVSDAKFHPKIKSLLASTTSPSVD